jgi:hypothetical protein
MSVGERAGVVGVLACVRPALAVEVGTAEGGSLAQIAAWSDEVHSFDLVAPSLPVAAREHVHLHTGDSHELLGPFLAEIAEQQRNVDFALVDGDHSADGARADTASLVESDACRDTVILLHDTAFDGVRRGLEQLRLERHPKVSFVDLDFIPGLLFHREDLRGQLWGGLGLVVLGNAAVPMGTAYHAPIEVLRLARETIYGDGTRERI